ncbi:unnamed protein product, partial [Laminaria digitata]
YTTTEPAEDVDPSSSCPEPCTGQIITYYWSSKIGSVYRLDRASADADPAPCWLPLFEEVENGPPVGGVTQWDEACLKPLLLKVEEEINGGGGDEGEGAGGSGAGGGLSAVLAAVAIPVLLVSFVAAAFLRRRHQQGQLVKKMKTTDELWGEGLDGRGGPRGPRPPTGRFKLVGGGGGVSVAPAAEGQVEGEEEEDGGESGIARVKSFPPPKRAFTDISMEDGGAEEEEEAEAAAAALRARQMEEGGRGRGVEAGEEAFSVGGGLDLEEEELGGEDMIYPMHI